MSDNVIKFKRPKPQKKVNPNVKKWAGLAAVIVLFVIIWAYFNYLAPH